MVDYYRVYCLGAKYYAITRSYTSYQFRARIKLNNTELVALL